MRRVTIERQRQRRRGRLTRLAVLLSGLLAIGGCAGTALSTMPLPLWGVIAAGILVGTWLVYALHSNQSHASMSHAVILLGLKLGILTSLALAVLGWIVLLKS